MEPLMADSTGCASCDRSCHSRPYNYLVCRWCIACGNYLLGRRRNCSTVVCVSDLIINSSDFYQTAGGQVYEPWGI